MASQVKRDKVLFWDFDGTLANRKGMWSGALLEAIRLHDPKTIITQTDISAHLQYGFPWHEPEVEHYHLLSPDEWWIHLEARVFIRALAALGYTGTKGYEIAKSVRELFLNSQSWTVVDGVDEVLSTLSKQGWIHIIISNHVPELNDLIAKLGLAQHFYRVFTSANMGVEKPHPMFLKKIHKTIGKSSRALLIGDSVRADISMGTAAGLETILIGSYDPSATHCVPNLHDVLSVLIKETV